MISLHKFFSAVHGSVQGIIISEELYRSILASLGSGTLVGVMIGVLQALQSHVATIFPGPTASTLATMFLTLVLDLLRRQNQGEKPAPVPIRIPNPAPIPQTA